MYSQLTRRILPARDFCGVERLELAAQVGEVGLGVERAANRALEQLRRLERPTPMVDGLAEPLAQRAELACLELRVEVAELGDRALPELNRDDIPERVRREVAEARAGPVNVLENALDDVLRLPRRGTRCSFASKASGRSAVVTVPASISRSSSKRRMM